MTNASDFGQICIMLCADHGPCVSGAHNTIVTARAGKDLVSCLVSGEHYCHLFANCNRFLIAAFTKWSMILKQVCSQLVLVLVEQLMMPLDTSRMLMTG